GGLLPVAVCRSNPTARLPEDPPMLKTLQVIHRSQVITIFAAFGSVPFFGPSPFSVLVSVPFFGPSPFSVLGSVPFFGLDPLSAPLFPVFLTLFPVFLSSKQPLNTRREPTAA